MNLYVCEGLFNDSKYTFYSGEGDYTLVYAETEPNGKFKPVYGEALAALNELEIQWLAECVADLCEEPEDNFVTVEEWFDILKTAFQEGTNEQL